MREEQISKNLMMLNKEYLDLRESTAVKKNKRTVWNQIEILTKYLKAGRFKEIFIKLRKRIEKQQTVDMTEEMLESIDLPEHLRVVVYTCIIGDYDHLKEPLYVNKCCDFVVITDQEVPTKSIWKKQDVSMYEELKGKNGAEINRWVKLHPHKLFPTYDYSVYVDGSILVVADVLPLVACMEQRFLGVHKLASGLECVYEGAKVVIASKKAPREIVQRQMSFYEEEGYPRNNGMYENGILIRKHNDERCIKVMEDWWNQLVTYSMRDQLSLNYVLWSNKIEKKEILLLGNNLYRNPRFRVCEHHKK